MFPRQVHYLGKDRGQVVDDITGADAQVVDDITGADAQMVNDIMGEEVQVVDDITIMGTEAQMVG